MIAYILIIVLLGVGAVYFTIGSDAALTGKVDAEATALATANAEIVSQTQQIQALNKSNQDLSNDVADLQRTVSTGAKPTRILQSEALALSNNILKFLATRANGEPPYSMSTDISVWQAASAKREKYDQETVSMYLTQFGSNVSAVVDQLARVGVEDKELTNSVGWIPGLMAPGQIQKIAIKLGALAREVENAQ